MDHPLIEAVAVLEELLVLSHLLKLCDHLGDPAKERTTLDTEPYIVITQETKNLAAVMFLKYYINITFPCN
jgi:hypothetical protein